MAVLNHRRPHLLARVLSGIDQLRYPNFEVVVVGDLPDIDAYNLPSSISRQIRYVQFVEPNIGRARNLALRASAGEFIAFIDDDAVPEPSWLTEIMRGFMRPDVGAVGGLVRGADGISIEWDGGVFDRAGTERKMAFPDDVRAFDAESQVAGEEFIGILGANSAFRVEAVRSVGGFDEAIRYYLDETDLMLRLAEAGWHSGLAKTAEVHHLREENTARDRMRVPRDLTEIAASKAYFCKRHLPAHEIDDALNRYRKNRRRELDPFIRLGLLRQRDARDLLAQVEDGIARGLARERRLAYNEFVLPQAFRRFVAGPEDGRLSIAVVSGWGLGTINHTRSFAQRLSRVGHSVSCFTFHSGALARSVEFEDGIWFHKGGTWRLDHRADGRRCVARRSRVASEIKRVLSHRAFDLLLSPPQSKHLDQFASAGAVPVASSPVPLIARTTKGSPWSLEAAVERLENDLQDGTTPTIPYTTVDLPHKQSELPEEPTLRSGF